jgi:hypothetical protein
MLGSRILRQAADAYDRAARTPYGRIPPPTPAGNRLRQAARLLSAFAYLTSDRSMAPIVLITKLAALAEAVAELRESQQHATQAAAARTAAERLYTAARPAPPAQPRPAPYTSAAAQLAGLSFPQPARPAPQPAAPRQPGPDQGGPPPARRPIATAQVAESAYLDWARQSRAGLKHLGTLHSIATYRRTASFRIHEPVVLPGIFQTEAYIRRWQTSDQRSARSVSLSFARWMLLTLTGPVGELTAQ